VPRPVVSGLMRRISAVDAMLLVTVTLWSLNFTASKYVLLHGFRPLAYSSIRYAAAGIVLAGIAYARERSFRVARRDFLVLVLPAAALLFGNQIGFVYSLKLTTATTVALILGATPVFAGFFGWLFGLEQLTPAFWLATAVSFGGVALVAAGSGSVSGSVSGDLVAIATAASWAAYSVLIVPLMRRYSAWRCTSLVMLLMSAGMLCAASTQLSHQSFSLGGLTWLAFGYSIAGPVVVAQVLWFTAVDRVGPARASLFANIQPFGGVLFAILLLSESLSRLEIAGGILIGGGVLLERRARARVVVVQQPPAD
jgi:drug/metabolite transporter (DMT)-like permease